jgi:hypothetical protein
MDLAIIFRSSESNPLTDAGEWAKGWLKAEQQEMEVMRSLSQAPIASV